MSSRTGVALIAAFGILAGCAAPPVVVVAPLVETVAPPVIRPEPVPLIEYPPIEPVEVPVTRSAALSPSPAPSTASIASSAAPEPALEPAAAVVPTEPTDEQQLAGALVDLQRYGGLTGDEIRRELTTVTQLVARQRSDYHRVRLAVLYTLTKAPQDDQRALQLLDNVAKSNPGSPAAKQLAAVVQVQLSERIRAVREEQQKSEAVVKKLEALRLMERDLLRDRIRGGGGGAGGGSSGGSGGGGGGGGGG